MKKNAMPEKKPAPPRASPFQAAVYRALWVVVFILAAALLAGTIYGLVKKAREKDGAARGAAMPGEGVFSGIGTLRVSMAGDEPAVLVVSVAFPYDAGDSAFTEELVARTGDFRAVASDFFGGFTAEELRNSDITAINKELLARYNALLRLGRIKELYFLDFIWL